MILRCLFVVVCCMIVMVRNHNNIFCVSFVLRPSLVCHSELSLSSQNYEKPKQSAFGKAAIGRRSNNKNVSSSSSSSSPSISGSSASSEVNRDEESQWMKKRDRALIALQTNLKKHLTLEESLEFLNAHPILITELPSLNAKLLYLLNEINLSPKRIATMLKKHPALLTVVFLDSEDNIASTMEILQTELGITSHETLLRLCEKLPSLLTYHRSELRQRINVYKNQLHYSTQDLQKVVINDPRMLRTPSSNVRQIILMLQQELNITPLDIQTMVRKEPLLLTYNAETNLRRTIHYLKDSPIGSCIVLPPITPNEQKQFITTNNNNNNNNTTRQLQELRLKKLIMGHPKIISSSIDKNLHPTVQFFTHDVQLTNAEFGRVLVRRGGSLLEANLERTLRTKVNFLRTRLALDIQTSPNTHTNITVSHDTNKEERTIIEIPDPTITQNVDLTDYEKRRLLAQMLAINPDILTLSIDSNLKPKFDYLYHELKLTPSQVRFLILKRPQLFSLSLEQNLRPKIQYLQSHSGDDYAKFIHWMVSNPNSLATVFDKRIQSRVQQIIQQLGYTTILHPDIPPNFLTLTEPSWNKWITKMTTGTGTSK